LDILANVYRNDFGVRSHGHNIVPEIWFDRKIRIAQFRKQA